MGFEDLQIVKSLADFVKVLNQLFTITAHPATGTDDGYHLSTSILYNQRDYVEIGNRANFATQGGYIRFPNVTIPPGVTILSAKARFKAYSTQSAAVAVRIKAVNEDNPSAPSTASEINSTAKTTAYVEWNPETWTQDEWYESPDFTTVIQEIVNRPGWSSGNAMILYLGNNATTFPNCRDYYTYEVSSGIYKPELIIEYTP